MKKKTLAKKQNKETLVNFILDKSGSMDSIKEATISGFNEYLNSLRKDGNKYSFSLTLFDTQVVDKCSNKPINEIDELTKESYVPDGCTALYDAVCSVMKKIKEKEGQKVINIIMTDGEENSSREYTEVQMKALIKEREDKGNWSFVYLGANQDSYVAAQRFGIPIQNTSNFCASTAGVRATMDMLANNTKTFAVSTTNATNCFFAVADQSKLENVDNKISQHFRALGKKSWEKRRKDFLN